jgi:hypothetical protein
MARFGVRSGSVVLDVLLDDQRVERVRVPGPERLEQSLHRLLVPLDHSRAMSDHSSSVVDSSD